MTWSYLEVLKGKQASARSLAQARSEFEAVPRNQNPAIVKSAVKFLYLSERGEWM